MTPEETYDTEIAPVLMAIANRCKELGWSMVASVEWQVGETGRTETHPAWNVDGLPSAKQKLVHYAARCHGNIDAMLMACIRDAEKYGHSSAYLLILGVKERPTLVDAAIARGEDRE